MIAGVHETQLREDIARLRRDADEARAAVLKSANDMRQAVDAANSGLSSIGIGGGLKDLAQMSDAYTKLTAQLRSATDGTAGYTRAYADVKRIAAESQADLGTTASMYADLSDATKEMGLSQKSVAEITESVSLSFKLSGTGAADANKAIFELSQAFATGSLGAKEFNTVNEAAPRLMQGIADSIGVPVGALQKMATEGKLTADVIADALPKALGDLQSEGAQMQTISGAFTVLKNNVVEFVGTSGEASGVVSLLTGGIGLLANNLTLVAGVASTVAAVKLGTWMAEAATRTIAAVKANQALAMSTVAAAESDATATAQASLLANARLAEVRAATLAATGNVQLALTTNGLIPAQASAAAAAEAHTVAMTQLTVAQRAASLGARAASGLLAAVGGPVGAVIAVLGLAAAAWSWYKEKKDEATAKAKADAGPSTDEIIVGMEKQNEKLRQRIELSKQAGMKDVAKEQDNPAVERLAELLKKMNDLKAQGSKISPSDSMQQIQYEGEYNALKKVVDANKELKTTTAEIGAAKQETAKTVSEATAAYTSLMNSIREKTAANRLEEAAGEHATESEKARIKINLELAGALSAAQKASAKAAIADMAASEAALKLRDAQSDVAKYIAASTAARDASSASLAAEYANYGKSADARELAMVQVRLEADMQRKLAEMREGKKPVTDKMIKQLQDETAARVEVEQATLAQTKALGYAKELAKDNQRAKVEAIADPKERQAKQLEAEADVWRERIKLAGKGTEAQKVLQQEFDVWYANRKKVPAPTIDLSEVNALRDAMAAVDDQAKSVAQSMEASFGHIGAVLGKLTTAFTGMHRSEAAIAAQRAAAIKDAGGDSAKIQKANDAAAEASAHAQIKSYGEMAGAAKGFFKENTTGYKLLEGAEKGFRMIEVASQMESLYTHLFVTGAKASGTAAGQVAETTAVLAGEAERNAGKIPGVIMSFMSTLGPWGMAAAAVAIAAVLGGAFGGGGGGKTAVNLNSAEERQKVQGKGTVLGDSGAKSESVAHSLEIMKKNSELELDYQNSMLGALQTIASALGGAAKGILQTAGVTGGSAFGTVAGADKAFVGASHTKDITDSGVQFSGTFGQLRSGNGMARQYEDVHTTSDGGMFRSGWSRNDTNYKSLSAEAMAPFTLIFDNMGNLLADAGTKLGRDGATLTAAIDGMSVDFGVSLRGLSGQDLTDALNAGVSVAFDKVTTQLFPTIRQFQKMGEGLGETLVRVASDVQGVQVVFDSMGKSLGGMSIEAKERLVQEVGGLDKLASSSKSFMQNFYSDTEQLQAKKAKLQPALSRFGLSTEGPDAQKLFRDFVIGLDTSTDAGAKTYAMLMNLQDAFHDVTNAAAGQRADLQDQLDELTLTGAQLLKKQRDALDDSNKALFDQVQAVKSAKDAQEEAKKSLGDFVGKMKSFADTTRGLNDSILLGDKTTLTPEQQYAEARRQFERTRQAAFAGDAAAQGNLSSVEQTFLGLSQRLNGGDARYSSDLATVMRTNDDLSTWAANAVDVAQASLDALTDSSATLTDISATLTRIAEGGPSLPGALRLADAPPMDYTRYGTLDMAPLVTEVKALREEVKGLRADQQKQTGDIIVGNASASLHAAEQVIEGVHHAVTDSAYAAANSTREIK